MLPQTPVHRARHSLAVRFGVEGRSKALAACQAPDAELNPNPGILFGQPASSSSSDSHRLSGLEHGSAAKRKIQTLSTLKHVVSADQHCNSSDPSGCLWLESTEILFSHAARSSLSDSHRLNTLQREKHTALSFLWFETKLSDCS